MHMSQVVHQARAYPAFCGMKQLRVRVDDGETQHIAGTPALSSLVTIIYLVGERHCERKVFCPRAHHNFFGWDLNHSIRSPANHLSGFIA